MSSQHSERLSSFYKTVSVYEQHSSKTAANGTKFICHTPAVAPLAYLHILYRPCNSDELNQLESLFGFELPPDYDTFMRLHNGASLFGSTVSLYGCGGNFSRSLKDVDRAAISIERNCEIFRAISKSDWNAGWRLIGSVVAEKQSYVLINRNGHIKFRHASGKDGHYKSLFEFLNVLLPIWSEHFDHTGAKSYNSLELIAERLVTATN